MSGGDLSVPNFSHRKPTMQQLWVRAREACDYDRELATEFYRRLLEEHGLRTEDTSTWRTA